MHRACRTLPCRARSLCSFEELSRTSTLRGSWWADRGSADSITGRVGDPGYVEPDSPYVAELDRGIFRIDSCVADVVLRW
jgi:hypothetical protein